VEQHDGATVLWSSDCIVEIPTVAPINAPGARKATCQWLRRHQAMTRCHQRDAPSHSESRQRGPTPDPTRHTTWSHFVHHPSCLVLAQAGIVQHSSSYHSVSAERSAAGRPSGMPSQRGWRHYLHIKTSQLPSWRHIHPGRRLPPMLMLLVRDKISTWRTLTATLPPYRRGHSDA
jgi:hypothetical protein